MTPTPVKGRYWEEIGLRIRKARLAAGMTQEELAARVGLQRTSIANIEAGRQVFDAVRLALFARALLTSMDALVSLD